MRFNLLLTFLLLLVICQVGNAQATFLSTGSGAWTTPGNWFLIGTDSDGNNYPDGNDAVIVNGHNMTITATTEACNALTLSGGSITFSGGASQLNVRGTLNSSGTSSVIGTSTNHRLVIINNGTTVLGNISVTGGTFTLNGSRLTNNGPTTIADGTSLVIDDATTPTVAANQLFSAITVENGGTFQNNDALPILIRGDISNNGTFNGCPDNSCNYNYNDGGTRTISGTSTTNMPRILVYEGSTLTNTGVISGVDLLGNANGTNTFVNEGQITLNTSGTIDAAELVLDFDFVGNTLTFTGSTTENLFLDGTNFYNLTVDLDDGTLFNMNNGVSPTIDNNLTVSSGTARIISSANTLTVGGNVSIAGDGTFFMNNTNAGQGINVTGSFDVSTTNVAGVDLNNGTISFGNMSITNGASVSAGVSDLTSSGTVTVTNGSFNADATSTPTFNSILVETNGSWLATSVYDPTINGSITNNGVFTACLNTSGCDYTLTNTGGTATIGGSNSITNLANLIINNGAIYTNTNTSAAGVLVGTGIQTTTGTGTFINGANATLDYSGTTGNFSVTNFTASASGNTVIFSRPDINQMVRLTTDANNTYHNLIINKANGIDVTLEGDITVANQLTMTAGDIILAGNDLIFADGATISGGSATSYIQDTGAGVIRQNYSAAGATLSFPIGDNDEYSPINSLTINSATFGASPSLDISVTDAVDANRDLNNQGAGGDDDGTISTVFLSRYWSLVPTDISNVTFSASYTYLDADVSDLPNEGQMIGTVYRAVVGEAFSDWSVEEGVNAVTNLVTVSSVESQAFGVLYAMDNTDTRLPIVLINFDAKLSGSSVFIEWSTATEINNNFFTIQRSRDASNWQDIITVDAAGNSDGILNYSVNDNFPFAGRSFYRLKQTDFDGSFTYSEVSSVLVADEITPELFLYPNPVSSGDLVNISLSSDVSESPVMRLMNMKGEVLMEKELNTSQTRVATSGLQKGVYLVVIRDSTGVFKKKLVIN